ncbi:MAG: hypothetical protein OQK75_02550 [Gammaproteobacteria bacterium]|nr:hypothetical protein [Gammaproteobacteria bacterium]
MQNFMTKGKSELSMIMNSHQSKLSTALFALLLILTAQVFADSRTQAKRMHDRLTGVAPSPAVLNSMEALLDTGNSADAVEAAYIAMNNKHFYNATLVNLITPWTNEARAVFPEDMDTEGTLNDYTATVIGAIRVEIDFRRILYDDILYVGAVGGLPAYSYSSNAHYQVLEATGADMGDPGVLIPVAQSANTGGVLTSADTAGVITTRAAAKAFFVDGTNRAMFRFTVLNHLCQDLEQLKDVTLPADRIRQDVSRSPGGDSRIFMNACIGCHTGMDPMTQAFAYYDYDKTANRLKFENGVVQQKNLINADNFKPGYIVTNNNWLNYWRQGNNSLLGWDTSLPGSGGGSGAASAMARELAHSEQFARCQVEKVFQAVCLRPAGNTADRSAVNNILANFKLPFKKSTGYELKRVFAETAVYCKGP